MLVTSSVDMAGPTARLFAQARVVWLAMHDWSGLAISITVLSHLALHMHWMRAMTARVFGRNRKRTGAPWTDPIAIPRGDAAGMVVSVDHRDSRRR